MVTIYRNVKASFDFSQSKPKDILTAWNLHKTIFYYEINSKIKKYG